MANVQQQSTGVRSDPGSEINPARSILPVDGKSFIVGKYDEYGHRKLAGKGADTSEISHITKLMNTSMKTRGGELMRGFTMTADGPVKTGAFTPKTQPKTRIVKPKKNKKEKGDLKTYLETIKQNMEPQEKADLETYLEKIEQSIEPVEESKLPEEVKETFPVTFNIDSGTVRSTVDAILEDDLGLILVYNDLNGISYEPRRGGKLTLTLPNRTVQVMYLGIKCQWFNTNQQLLVFVKLDKE